MPIRRLGTWALASVGAACLLLAPPPSVAEEIPMPEGPNIEACADAVNSHFKATYPKSSRFAWDLTRLTEEKSLFGDVLKGGGDFRGKGGKRRTFDFECTYDPYAGEVVKASWEASKEPGVVRLVIDLTDDMEILPGQTEEACTGALDETIRKNWPTYRELELLEETLNRRKTPDGYRFRGEGRFQGPAGSWHRYRFRCLFDGEDADFGWKRYGKEEDLDLD